MFQSFIGVDFWTALFILLNTLTLFYVAKKNLFLPVKKMIDSRQAEIDSMYDQADQAKAEALRMQTEYQQKLNDAQQTSEQMVKEAVARAQARQEEILRQANASASAMMDKASADIALEKKKALNDAKNEISGVAMAIAEKVVGRQLDERDQQQLVEQFIDSLGDAL